jgi:hypothetical protein
MAKYSEPFKAKVREVYGNQFDKMLQDGNEFLGRYLDDSSQGVGVTVDEILVAKSLNTLQEKVRKHKMRKELYAEYYKEVGR